MSEQLKYIVQELAKDPFKKAYNLISFDSLVQLQLLQILTDVLTEIDPKQKVDVREESPDQTAVRIFDVLKVLKYKPETNAHNISSFRQGIVQGDKLVIHPILEWLLKQLPSHKKRAYLARYLRRLEIPHEFLQDDQIQELHDQYERLMEDFKETHKHTEELKSSGFNTAPIKTDIANMEDEKNQLITRTERLKKKVESAPNHLQMLAVARSLRAEKDRSVQLRKQRAEEQNQKKVMQQKINRTKERVSEAKQASIGATPSGMLQKLEEETRTNRYVVEDRNKRHLESQRTYVKQLERIVAEPAMGQSDLDAIKEKIRHTNLENTQMIEKMMVQRNPTDDKLSLFKQQTGVIANKRRAMAGQLQEERDNYNAMAAEVAGKREQVSNTDGEEVLKGDEFKKFVNNLRTKSNVYKKKRQELAEYRAEVGILSRTEEILKRKDEAIDSKLGVLEKQKGVAGYRDTQEKLENVSSLKSELDHMKGQTLENMSEMVQKFNRKINEKKASLAPIIKELRPLRLRHQELNQEHTEKKQSYDNIAAGLESNMMKLDQEVRGYREEISADESRYHYLHTMLLMCQQQEERVTRELKAYRSSDATEKKRTVREQITRKIQEQETQGRQLKDQQKGLKDGQEHSHVQQRLWKDLERLMEMKLKCAGQMTGIDDMPVPKQVTEDRLVL